MVARGCERNVITFSSLISAAEKAGRPDLALQLWDTMHAEGCRPNVVTYNSLIAACAHGEEGWGCVGCWRGGAGVGARQ
jgi:pentatricopeptide repeat domain-containing protein 1